MNLIIQFTSLMVAVLRESRMGVKSYFGGCLLLHRYMQEDISHCEYTDRQTGMTLGLWINNSDIAGMKGVGVSTLDFVLQPSYKEYESNLIVWCG